MILYKATSEGNVPMTEDETAEFVALQQTFKFAREAAAVDAQIATLEAQITQRRVREAIISGDSSFLASIDARIATLRAKRQT